MKPVSAGIPSVPMAEEITNSMITQNTTRPISFDGLPCGAAFST